ncbi:MAG: hypothetical protein JWR12_1037 [Mucilaginibacter sp.]|nr:hypothetical protein [Mucilaginibacter sp.]
MKINQQLVGENPEHLVYNNGLLILTVLEA